MGQTLSEPVTDKSTAHDQDDRLAWAVSEMQGWRLSMEDAHAHVLSMTGDEDGLRRSFFAVYDGHGGSTVARFAGDTVHERLAATEAFKSRDYPAALKRAFLATDEDLRSSPDFRGDPSGCTAVALLVTEDNTLICANAGDSRCVMSVGGEAKQLSYDHKPTNASESSRIVSAGGFVEFGRVNGNLALSRALGDFEFKQQSSLPAEEQIVTADPDIIVHQATSQDEFVILACDGIWDVLSSQQAIDWVRRGIAEGRPLDALSEQLLDRCLAPDSDWGGVGCDNMTAIIVALKHGRSTEDWYDWVRSNVESSEGYQTPAEFHDPFSSQQRAGPAGPSFSLSGVGSGTNAGSSGDHEHGGEDEDEELDLPALQAVLRAEGFRLALSDEADEGEQEATSDDEENAANKVVELDDTQGNDSMDVDAQDAKSGAEKASS